ncbi:non-ribosomal peptide synthetase, partial [Trinickia mobilis]|uniref:non-ribosomal peptide synthetase n=1 Tax=Trinickia mobilis TaxID=2816356 RepID=UPI001A8F268C
MSDAIRSTDNTAVADAGDGAPFDDALHRELAAELGIAPRDLDPRASLLQLGLDSMHLMAWLNRLRSRGHRLTLRELYREPTLAGWSALVARAGVDEAGPATAPGPHAGRPSRAPANTAWPTMRDGAPFVPTPVQHAYFVGRSPQQPLGGVGCHLYQEFDGAGLAPEVLEGAVAALIARHPMLQVAFCADGLQQWREQPAWPGLTVHDLRELPEGERERRLAGLRETLGHRVLAVERGETFDFQLSLLPEGRQRLHVNLDLLVLDAASFTLIFEELAALVAGKPLPPSPGHYDFCSYLAQSEAQTADARDSAKRYWRRRLATLPPAPELPLAQEPERIAEVRVSRRRAELDADTWRAFHGHAGECGVTPAMALATAFGAVLARWSSQARLLLNLTLFDRRPLDAAVERMIADFTSILLLDLACEGDTFASLARANQDAFAEAYEHRDWSGVEVLRELRKEGRHPHGAPIVFTSNLGRPLYGEATADALGEPGWGISQTPQVWIDHLAFEHASSVWLQWDSNDTLFPAGLVDALFDAYAGLVRRLAGDAAAWREPLPDLQPNAQREVRARVNATACPLPDGLLHDGFFRQAERTPQAAALVHDDAQLSYAELAALARRCAGALTARGVRPGARVAVSMSKGLGQIVAVLGALCAGAVYVPVPLDQPLARRRQIYDDAGVALVLVCAKDRAGRGARESDADAADQADQAADRARHLDWQEAVRAEPLTASPAVDAHAPAYVIYTSGSTGTPKGVVISHRGALNTCADLNRRYGVGPADRVLAISALHFDLSVYDIFGLLSAGGALVLLDESRRRDPSAWCRLIERHGITLWNSVPALFDMLLTYAEGFALGAPSALRAAMLSGDWIGLDLPARYRAFRPDGAFIAMGGATEASIWSNVCDVAEVPREWRSIPYGHPLANQRYRVVDEQGRDCPDWVPGELWIGGAGVALGYFNDAARTAQQFVAAAGERWYRTGDLGCYWPGGTLEFLGRRDKQVKIGGYRIELGEIDAALARLDGIKSGIALAYGEREKSLAAFVVGAGPALSAPLFADPAAPPDYGALFAAGNGPAKREYDEREARVAAAAHGERGEHETRLVADFLYEHLLLQGLDFNSPLGVDDVLTRYGAAPARRGLLARWLALLAASGRLQDAGDGRYRNGPRHDAPWSPPAGDALAPIAEALPGHHAALAGILRGERPAETLLDHPRLSPEHLLRHSDGASAAVAAFAAAVAALARVLRRPVRVVEIGARTGLGGAALLARLGPEALAYTALDESQERVLRARERLAAYPHASVRRWDACAADPLRHSADVVWADNALHRLGERALDSLAALAAPSALVHVLELRQPQALALVTADLLTHDSGGGAGRLRDASGWLAAFRTRGLHCERADIVGAQQRFVLRAAPSAWRPDPGKLKAALAAQLPSYMLPQRVYFLDAMPLTANGKVDHKALAARAAASAESAAPDAARETPEGAAEATLAALWRKLLETPAMHRRSHFFELGGDSLLATRLIGELNRAGYGAQLGDLYDYPTLAAFAATLRARPAGAAAPALRHDAAARHRPFALTDVQQAYLVGRRPGFPLGGVGSHFFVEFEVEDLDVPRFEAAFNRLIARHDMLRAVVRNGLQQVLPEVPAFVLPLHCFAELDGTGAHALRERLAHQVLDPSRWPVFDVQAASAGGRLTRLYLCLDNLLLDGLSMQILLAELEQGYLEPGTAWPPLEIGFRDYAEHAAKAREAAPSEASAASRAYWRRRLDTLPPAPQLPLARQPAEAGVPHFVRLSDRLPAPAWRVLKERAAAAHVTPSALLLSAYAAVLSAFSTRRNLCLNLTLFDRQPVHPQIERVLGDFTSLLLVAWQPGEGWLDSVQRLQQRLWQDLAHRDVSALWVMRELARRRGLASTEMPVVFTSALGFETERFLAHASWLKPRSGISQTPQVWLDHQVYESEGELRFNWDAVEALFEPETLRAMFGQYVALLRRLAADADAWRLPLDTLVPRAPVVPPAPVVPLAPVVPPVPGAGGAGTHEP